MFDSPVAVSALSETGRILLNHLMFQPARRFYAFLPKSRFRIRINHPSIVVGQMPVVVGA
jgi:hypothetical protein